MNNDEPTPTCKLECEDNDFLETPRCDDEFDGYICTRRKDHEGPHVACGHADHEYEIWEKTP